MLTVNSLSGFGSRAAFATVVIPSASDWMNVDSDLTFGTGTLDANGEGSGRTKATFTGDVELQFTITNEVNCGFGFYESGSGESLGGEDGTYSNGNNIGSMTSMTDSWFYNGGDNSIYYGGSAKVTSVTWSGGDIAKISRVGSTFEMFKNGSSLHQFADTSANEIRIVIGGGGGTTDLASIQWTI